jgi:AraC-like DNA-binding protein
MEQVEQEFAGSLDAEDFDPPAEPMVSGVYLRVLADVVTRNGISPETLFLNESRDFETHEPIEVRVPLSAYRRLLERAASLTHKPAIGLHCGLFASVSAYDLLAPLVAHVPNLRAAIAQIRQFQSLSFEGAFLHLTERGPVARLSWEFPKAHDGTDASIAEFLISGLMRLIRVFGCTQKELLNASFEHRRPAYHAEYASVFEGAERFSESFTGLEFDGKLLDKPNLYANRALHSVIHAQAEERLHRLAQPSSLIDQLRVYLRNNCSAGVPDMAMAARRLGVSSRSLSRRLAEQRTSYRTLTQEAQRELACTMLRNPEFTLQAVAGALRFADTASFCRAFKRWTGRTASEYRDTH